MSSGSTFTVFGDAPAAAQAPAEPLYHHRGTLYYDVLGWIHAFRQTKRYLEIGSATGGSLQRANCATIAIDPRFAITTDVIGKKPALHLFQVGSDTFFAEQDPARLLGGPLDFAFLDGMHQFEFLLRDFMNAERCCEPGAVIALHDCLPIDRFMTDRIQRPPSVPVARPPQWWTGDVYKVVEILRRFRPDLRITSLDAAPTGLVLCTNLDPSSTVLQQSYDAIVAEWQDQVLDDDHLRRYLHESQIISASEVASPETMAHRLFG